MQWWGASPLLQRSMPVDTIVTLHCMTFRFAIAPPGLYGRALQARHRFGGVGESSNAAATCASRSPRSL